MVKKHKEKLNKGKLNLSRIVVLMMGFSQALLAYVMSSYFELATGMQNVGIFYAFSYAVFLIILLNLHKLVKIWGKSNIYQFSLLAKILIAALMVYFGPSWQGVLLLMLYIISGHIEWVAMDLIVESFSTDKMSGRIRGAHLTILNAGFLLGPFVSTRILEHSGFEGIFLFTLILSCVIFVFSLIGFRNVNHRFERKMKIFQILRKVWKKKDVMRIYYVSCVLEFFFAMMVIYMPIYLRNLGYSWESIGWIFTFMLVPFLLIQYPIGVLADRKTGEKEFIIFSILIMAVATGYVYFIGTATIAIWAMVLFVTRIGASSIEVLRDSYFFKKVDATDVDMIDFFRTASPAGYIMAAAVSSLVLIFFPVKAIFALVGIVALSALWPVFRMTDNKAECDK